MTVAVRSSHITIINHTVYSVRNVQCTMYTLYKPTAGNQFSCITYTYSTAKLLSHVEAASPPRLDLSPGGPGRGKFTARPTIRWEGPISRVRLPFPSTGFPSLGLYFFKWKLPHFFQIEDDLNFVLGNLRSWFLVCNIVSTQLDGLNFLKMEDELMFLKMKDNLHF
jgi:hypothetical protein